MTEALFFLQRDACWDVKLHSVPSLPSFMARDRGYLREGSGSTWSLSPRPRATPNSAAAELAAGTERRQPCCQGLRQLRELGGGRRGVDSTPPPRLPATPAPAFALVCSKMASSIVRRGILRARKVSLPQLSLAGWWLLLSWGCFIRFLKPLFLEYREVEVLLESSC